MSLEKVSVTHSLMVIDAARQSFDMKEIRNRRFLYAPDTCALILGRQSSPKNLVAGSHAEDHGISGAAEGFDSFLRGWIGTGAQYRHGVIHFAPPIDAKDPDRFLDGYNALQMFRENGAGADTVVRGFGKVWEQPLSAILPGFTKTIEKESEVADMPYYGVWAARGSGSVLGPAEAWSKKDGVPEVFPTKEAAERQAEQYNKSAASPHVHYSVREMEPELAQSAMKEQAFAESRDVYIHPAAYAREHGELNIYRTSNRLNRECAQAIGNAVNESWDGSRIDPEGARGVIEQYGGKRVSIVLAGTVCQMDYDDRFSRDNRDWAEAFPKLERAGEYTVNAHPLKLDGFIHAVRSATAERNAGDRAPAQRESAAAKLEAAKRAVKPRTPKAPGKKNDLGKE